MLLTAPLSLTIAPSDELYASAPFYLEELAPASPQPSFRPGGPSLSECLAACPGPTALDTQALCAASVAR